MGRKAFHLPVVCFICYLCLFLLLPLQAFSAPSQASKDTKPNKKQKLVHDKPNKKQKPLNATNSKVPTKTLSPKRRHALKAALELQKWLAPISPLKKPTSGIYSVRRWLHAYIVSRWGILLHKKAKSRWKKIQLDLRNWDPAKLYRQIKSREIHPRFFTSLRKGQLFFTAPNSASLWPEKKKKGGFHVKVIPLKRKKKKRPYRLQLEGQLALEKLLPEKIDGVLQAFIHRMTDPKLDVNLPPSSPQYYRLIRSGQSLRVAKYLSSRFPRISKILNQYFYISKLIEPTKNGQYRVSIHTKWNHKALAKDYPAWARYLKNPKGQFKISTEFLDDSYRRWMVFSYNRKTALMRFTAMVDRKGFLLCDSNWKPLAGPWRPSQNLNTNFFSKSQVSFASSYLSGQLKNIYLSWKIRKSAKGASMELRLKREPHIKLSGGRVLRLLARVLISGGVRGLLQRMLRNLTYADNGKGFTWKGEMLQNPTYTSVEFLMKAPIVPSRVLSSTMRLLNRFSRRRSRMRSRPPVKFDKAKRKPRVRSGKRRKVRISYRRYRRKRKGSLWMRIFVALYRDLKAAEQIIP